MREHINETAADGVATERWWSRNAPTHITAAMQKLGPQGTLLRLEPVALPSGKHGKVYAITTAEGAVFVAKFSPFGSDLIRGALTQQLAAQFQIPVPRVLHAGIAGDPHSWQSNISVDARLPDTWAMTIESHEGPSLETQRHSFRRSDEIQTMAAFGSIARKLHDIPLDLWESSTGLSARVESIDRRIDATLQRVRSSEWWTNVDLSRRLGEQLMDKTEDIGSAVDATSPIAVCHVDLHLSNATHRNQKFGAIVDFGIAQPDYPWLADFHHLVISPLWTRDAARHSFWAEYGYPDSEASNQLFVGCALRMMRRAMHPKSETTAYARSCVNRTCRILSGIDSGEIADGALADSFAPLNFAPPR